MGCSVAKVFLSFLTIVFWAAAAGLIYVGAWVFKEYHNYDEITKATFTLIPASILIGVGAFLFILGLVGCVGAFKEQRCMLGVFFTFLLVILVGMVLAASLGYVYRNEVKSHIEDGLKKAFNNYGGNDTALTHEVDFMQQELKCCGYHNYSDWVTTSWGKMHPNKYPNSCCPDNNCSYVNTTVTTVFAEGCHDRLQEQFQRSMGIIVGVAAVFAVIQVLGMICSCVLLCRRRTDNPYIGLTSPEHMRV